MFNPRARWLAGCDAAIQCAANYSLDPRDAARMGAINLRARPYREDDPPRGDERWLTRTFVPQLPDGDGKLARRTLLPWDLYTPVERNR